MAQIEDVARTSAGLGQDCGGASTQFLLPGKQNYRIKIALNGAGARKVQALPGLVKRNAPVTFMDGRSVAVSVPK
jgi:hypothetical protein